jgi:hypothetical protein
MAAAALANGLLPPLWWRPIGRLAVELAVKKRQQQRQQQHDHANGHKYSNEKRKKTTF